MVGHVHPRHLRKALDLVEADIARAWTVGEIAAACGVARRTLQKHFRRFVGKTPLEYLRDLRFDKARQTLLEAPRGVLITEIATRCGFCHLGRFAVGYRERFNETPSQTVRRSQLSRTDHVQFLPALPISLERPSVAVLPFELVGEETRRVAAMAEEIAAALMRLHWIGVATPERSRYRLRGKVRGDGRGRLRITVILTDASTGRHLWADHWDGTSDDAFQFEQRVAGRVARAIELVLRDAEIDGVSGKDAAELNAWELAMRALPGVISYKAPAEARALELLERAMEMAPHDPLPVSLAAWCHGVRGCLHFTAQSREEQETARRLADRAVILNKADALTETVLAAGYTLGRNLEMAAVHADRALVLNGGSAWAWARSGWISAYNGEEDKAIERLQLARTLGPADPVSSATSCFGIGSAHFRAGRYGDAIRWIKRGIAERPDAVGMSPFFLASAQALANRKDEAKRTVVEWTRVHRDMTITQVNSGWPFEARFLDRVAEGLESAGMRSAA